MNINDLVAKYLKGGNPEWTFRGSVAGSEGGIYVPSIGVLTYAATIAVPLATTTVVQVTLTNGVAFQFLNPTSDPAVPAIVLLRIINASGGAHGAGTFDTDYNVSANVPAIATGFNRTIAFLWNLTDYIEIFRTAADVPN